MYTQKEYLREGVTMVRNQTYRLDLPKSGLLSSLLFKLSASCASGATLSVANWRLEDYLTKVEIIGNGATIIKSLDVAHLQFMAWLNQGIVPPHYWRNYATNTQFAYFMVMFGRFIGDPNYGLDLSRFDSVELRVTNTATSTYYGTDITASILQTYMRELPGSFAGYVRSEEFRKWTTVQNATEYLLLPTEYPISRVVLRAVPSNTNGVFDTNPQNLMSDIDFSFNGRTKQVYKGGFDDLLVQNYMERGAEVLVGGQLDGTADYGKPISVARGFNWGGISGSKDGAVSSTIPTIEADPTDGYIKPEAREADSPIMFLYRGMGYEYSTWLHNSPDLSLESLIDPANAGEINLDIQTANASTAASGTNTVILERLVR